jgi:hypothetical protein
MKKGASAGMMYGSTKPSNGGMKGGKGGMKGGKGGKGGKSGCKRCC